eukprot:PhM_4_TR5001/c0_g1_i1/m.2814
MSLGVSSAWYTRVTPMLEMLSVPVNRTTTPPWDERVDAIATLQDMMLHPPTLNLSGQQNQQQQRFTSFVRDNVCTAIALQLTDLRSAVVKEACSWAATCMRRDSMPSAVVADVVAEALLPALYKNTRATVAIVAGACTEVLAVYFEDPTRVPDKCLKLIVQHCNKNTHKAIRAVAVQNLAHIARTLPDDALRKLKAEMSSSAIALMSDPNPDVRQYARAAIESMQDRGVQMNYTLPPSPTPVRSSSGPTLRRNASSSSSLTPVREDSISSRNSNNNNNNNRDVSDGTSTPLLEDDVPMPVSQTPLQLVHDPLLDKVLSVISDEPRHDSAVMERLQSAFADVQHAVLNGTIPLSTPYLTTVYYALFRFLVHSDERVQATAMAVLHHLFQLVTTSAPSNFYPPLYNIALAPESPGDVVLGALEYMYQHVVNYYFNVLHEPSTTVFDTHPHTHHLVCVLSAVAQFRTDVEDIRRVVNACTSIISRHHPRLFDEPTQPKKKQAVPDDMASELDGLVAFERRISDKKVRDSIRACNGNDGRMSEFVRNATRRFGDGPTLDTLNPVAVRAEAVFTASLCTVLPPSVFSSIILRERRRGYLTDALTVRSLRLLFDFVDSADVAKASPAPVRSLLTKDLLTFVCDVLQGDDVDVRKATTYFMAHMYVRHPADIVSCLGRLPTSQIQMISIYVSLLTSSYDHDLVAEVAQYHADHPELNISPSKEEECTHDIKKHSKESNNMNSNNTNTLGIGDRNSMDSSTKKKSSKSFSHRSTAPVSTH